MTQERDAVPDALPATKAEHRRLQTLVGELLQANQELRFKVERLEREAEVLKYGPSDAIVWAGILL